MHAHDHRRETDADAHASSQDAWLAYRYVAGDLDELEWAAFEERLADDFSLQMTLAETVTLTSGLSRIGHIPTPKTVTQTNTITNPSPTATPVSAWVRGAMIAVCLLAVGGMLRMVALKTVPARVATVDGQTQAATLTEHDHADADILYADEDVSSVVALWSALGNDAEAERTARGEERLTNVEQAEIDVPDWLLLAVFDETPESPALDTPSANRL